MVGLLLLVPAVFDRSVVQAFELPKTSVLATGMLALLAWLWARELGRMRDAGRAAWIGSLGRRMAASAGREPVGAAVAFFLVSSLASTLGSIRPAVSFFGDTEGLAGFKTALATASIFYASRSLASSPTWFTRMTHAVALAAALASGYGLLQLARLDPFRWARTATFGGELRVASTLGHPNHLGAYLAMALPFVGWRWARGRTRVERAGWLVVAAASLVVIVGTLSRGAWIGLAAGVAGFGLMAWRARQVPLGGAAGSAGPRGLPRRRGWIAVALPIAAAAVLVPFLVPLGSGLFPRIRQIVDLGAPSTQSRLWLWKAGLRMAAEHPILGVGVDAYGAAFPAYRTPELWRIEWAIDPVRAHNQAIHIVATQGLLGGIAALLVVLLLARAGWRATAHPDAALRRSATLASAALVVFAVQDLASFTTAATGSLAAALAGWLAAAGGGGAAAGVVTPHRPARSTLGLGSGVLLAGVAFVPLVALPWQAARANFRALELPIESPRRVEELARAVAIAPWTASYRVELGRTLLVQGLEEPDPGRSREILGRARHELTRAMREAPRDGYVRAFHARVLAAQSAWNSEEVSPAEVRRAFSEALTRDPYNPYLLVMVEQGLFQAGLSDEGRVVALKCATLYPDFGLPVADLGAAALRDGRTADAADTLGLALRRGWFGERESQAAAWSSLSEAYSKLGRPDDARAAEERADSLQRVPAGAP